MEQKARPNRRRLILLILLGIFICLGLCVGGLALPGKELPVISMAAERIPLGLPLPGFEEGIPNTLPTAILATLVLTLIALAYWRAQRRAARTGQESRFLIVVDTLFEGVYSFVESVAGEHLTPIFFPLVASFFLFILTANWMGLIPGVGSIGVWGEHHGETVLIPIFRSANADLSTTLGLAVVSVIATQYFGFRLQGRRYLRKFVNFTAPPNSGALRPVLVIANSFVGILELISEVIKIFSFAFRLFGNIFAGEVLLVVVSFLAAFVATIPFMGLELFVGLIQALIFSMLSLIFFTMAAHHH